MLRTTGRAALAWLTLAASPPLTAATGMVMGRLTGEDVVIGITASCRADGQRYVGVVDSARRRFEITGLPLDRDLDCIVDYRGARLEGVNFKVPRSDYQDEQPLSAADAQFIRERVLKMNVFEDQVAVLAVDGNIQQAVVLVNKVRTKPFVNSKPGEIIWRVELWHYERPEEDWVRAQEDFHMLYRERIPRAEFEKKSVTFDPALGGVRLTAEHPTVDLGEITPPTTEPGIRYRDERKQP